MIAAMIAVFIIGYVFIALEHKTGVNKSAVALIMCGVLWSIFMLGAPTAFPSLSTDVVNSHVIEYLGEACEILVFLIGAMTIVELIDRHGGFDFITRKITTSNKTKLMWILTLITFFMSAILDNMTTTIIMIMLMRKLIVNYKERWIFASLIVIAANSGGAWSPIGDVTTIMLWMKGNVSTVNLTSTLLLPCMVSVLVPTLIATHFLKKGTFAIAGGKNAPLSKPSFISEKESLTILIIGTGVLVCVPLFKSLTNLPPYMGVMLGLGIIWTFTELMYDRKRGLEESSKRRVSKVIEHIDMPTILFFLGILMSVSALQSAGILSTFANALDSSMHNVFAINGFIGLLSSVVDNVPLVAACIGMYPIPDAAAIAASADPAFTSLFVADGLFWHLLAYCAGVGGSILIIGSTAGVVAMGLEKINFMWYLKNISRLALSGYLAGMVIIYLQTLIFGI